jgi:SAM-dependent methyltransferase
MIDPPSPPSLASPPSRDHRFAGSIPLLYDTYFVPLLFEPYAADLVHRLSAMPVSRVLEIAAGTGAVTRALAAALPPDVSIVATDLNQAMLDRAAAVGTRRPVVWRQADAMQLPFPDAEFDAVVCQFGAMFFPDRAGAFAQARRVLRRGGVLIFNVWDKLAENELADIVTEALESVFPADPPRFMARIPHGYHDPHVIQRDLAAGGFSAAPEIVTVEARSRAASARIAALAFCQGTPLRNEIEARDAGRLDEATDAATAAIARRFGSGAVDGKMRAHVVVIRA